MYHPISLELKNYRIIPQRNVEIQPGTTAFIGPNGTGKSSTVSAMHFALTGIPLGDDDKKDLLRWHEKKGYVRHVFTYQGEVYTIERSLSGPSVVLRKGNDAFLSGKAAVDSFMEAVLEIPPSLLSSVSFIVQEGVDTELKETPAKRCEFFNKLARVDKANDILSRINKIKASLPAVSSVSFNDELEAVDRQLATAKQDLEAFKTYLAAITRGTVEKYEAAVVTSQKASLDTLRKEDELRKNAEVELKRLRAAPVDKPSMSKMELLYQLQGAVTVMTEAERRGAVITQPWEQAVKPVAQAAGVDAWRSFKGADQAKKEYAAQAAAYEAYVDSVNMIQSQIKALDDKKRDRATPSEIAEAKDYISAYKEGERLYTETEKQIAVVETNIQHYEKQLKQLQEQKAYAEVIERKRLELQRAADVFRKDALPKTVSSKLVCYVADRQERYRDWFSLRYKIRLDPDTFEIRVIDEEGTEHNFQSLSGGQRKIAAVTFRLAVADVMAGKFGFMVLDEPLAGVDEDGVNEFGSLLAVLGEQLRKEDRVLWVLTHDKSLFPENSRENGFTAFNAVEKFI